FRSRATPHAATREAYTSRPTVLPPPPRSGNRDARPRTARVGPMGTLTYDTRITASFDDRVLAHLQAVIWARLRRGESFPFTWTDSTRSGFGRTSIWLSPNLSLSFEYFGSRQPRLNPAWIEALT